MLLVLIKLIFQVFDTKRGVATLNLDLFEYKTSAKGDVMGVFLMTKALAHNLPILQPSIDCFMSRTGFVHCQIMLYISRFVWSYNSWVSSVAFISHNLFTNTKPEFKPSPEDLKIRPPTTFKRSIIRNYLASFDAHCKLIANACSTRLVRVPLRIKRCWLKDWKVDTVNCHKASLSIMAIKALLPIDL